MTQKAAVLGHPIHHSLSPKLHGYWIDKYNLDAHYLAIDVKPGTLEGVFSDLIKQGYKGVNITIPYKEEAYALANNLDEYAKMVKAVNTIQFDDGLIKGYNTDIKGIIDNINGAGYPDVVAQKHVMILGAGGAARACIYAMIKEGASKITITNRTVEKAINLQQEFSKVTTADLEVIKWNEKEIILSDIGLIINTTSLGMQGMPDLEIDLKELPSDAVVYDIVYNPLMTNFLLQAQEKGLATITGIGMLLYQAVPAFELWFGVKPEVTKTLEEHILSS